MRRQAIRFHLVLAAFLLAIFPAIPCLAADAPFAGKYSDGKLTVDLSQATGGFAGSFTLGSQQFPASAHASGNRLDGTFAAGGANFSFNALLEADTLTLTSDGKTYTLKRISPVANPLGIGGPAPAPRGEDAPAAPQPGAGASTSQPATMRFKRFAITDDQGFQGMEVMRGVMPVDWTVKGSVTWKLNLGIPDLIRIHWADAKDVCAFDLYPNILFSWNNAMERGGGNYEPGQVANGNILQRPPSNQFDAIEKVIVQMMRPDLANAKVVNREKLPDAAKAIYAQVNTDPNWPVAVAVGRETFEYELHGQTVQEIIGGVLEVGGDNSQGGYKVWGLSQVTSKRAPKGQLDQLTPISAVMVQSLEMNPEWSQKLAGLLSQRKQQTLANQQQQAARQQAQFNANENRISSQTAANDAQHQSYWQHSADLNRQSENEADIQREVSPWKDSSGASYKLPTQYGHAWSGADGTIIMNNDPSYNPNQDPNLSPTNWTPMEQTQN